MKKPGFAREHYYLRQGYTVIAGVDEAGAGALAGPVVAAAVVLPLHSRLGKLDDSKRLTAKQRAELYEQIICKADDWAIGSASHEEIDAINIRNASLLAMRRALEKISGIEVALIDAWSIPELPCIQEGIIHGDQLVKSIAAASVLAKVTRDRLMHELDSTYPLYGFAKHKGYGTRVHQLMIQMHGPCAIHRMSFAPCKTS